MQKIMPQSSKVESLLRSKLNEVGLGKCSPSSFEINVASVLIKHNLDFDFNQKLVCDTTAMIPNLFATNMPLNFKFQQDIALANVPMPHETIFRPDFIIKDLEVNKKSLVLEPHGKQFFDDKRIRKYKSFMDNFGSDYYFVIITDMTIGALNRKLMKCGLKINDICSEVIYSKRNGALQNLEKRLIKFERQKTQQVIQ
jgi:hypothetical protein